VTMKISNILKIFFVLKHQVLALSKSVALPSLCVKESSLDLQYIHLVSEQHLKHATVPGCIVHCLEKSDVTHVLVSYHHGILGLFGDQFNCICAKEEALQGVKHLGDNECLVECPEGDHMCGDSSRDLLSAYCLYDDCQHKTESDSMSVCVDIHNTTEVQGCVMSSNIVTEHVNAVVNFTGDTSADCAIACRKKVGEGVAFSRVMSSALECKCGSLDSIIGNMLTTSVCNSISLLDTEIMFVTCEDAYPATSKPYHEAVSSEEEIALIDHVKLGIDFILFLVCFLLILMIVIIVLRRYWRSKYNEME